MTQPHLQQVPDGPAAEGEVAVGPSDKPAAPAALPTRDELRARIREALESGQINERDVLADIYASQYSAELSLRQLLSFLDKFATSGIGKRLLRRSKKDVAALSDEIGDLDDIGLIE